VERYRDLALEIKRIHRATKVAATTIMIGALGTISKNAKAWYWRLSLPDIIGMAQFSAILELALFLSSRKCCVSKLQESAEAWLRSPEKKKTLERISHH